MQPERADMTQDLGALSGSQATPGAAEEASPPIGFDPARWLELAKCCEVADGPSSEIDEAINNLVSPPRPYDPNEGQPPPGFGEEPHLHLGYWGTPYTLSIDVAQSLVPEGWQGERMSWWSGCASLCVLVETHLVNGEWVRETGWLGRVKAEAATPALAMCAAALRAIAMEARQSGDREAGLRPKDDSAGPQDIAQGPSQ